MLYKGEKFNILSGLHIGVFFPSVYIQIIPLRLLCQYDVNEMMNFFVECKDCLNEKTHMCKFDMMSKHITKFKDLILRYEHLDNGFTFRKGALYLLCESIE